mmetsp:Transcript_15444/g.41679  ORF Transcript_15444/g.41679 Transcript_15444/m.41679 type:complete len:160 (-) Transcript_15444:2200-2679(-)
MHPVIAVRRLACACDGCRRALKRPVATGSDPYATGTRYAPHDDCARAAMMGRRNDWKLVSLKPSGEAAAVRMEEDNDETTEELKLPLMDADGNAVILRNRSSRRSERRSRRPMVRTRGSSLQRARASCRKRCTMICLRSWTAVINAQCDRSLHACGPEL